MPMVSGLTTILVKSNNLILQLSCIIRWMDHWIWTRNEKDILSYLQSLGATEFVFWNRPITQKFNWHFNSTAVKSQSDLIIQPTTLAASKLLWDIMIKHLIGYWNGLIQHHSLTFASMKYCIWLFHKYHQTSNIRHTKSQNLNCLVLQLSLSNPLKPGVKLRIKM